MTVAERLKAPHRWQGVRIFGYHRLSENPETLSVAPEAFRRQMEHALSSGAEPVRLASVIERLRRPIHGRYFCVTFDDGYRDCLEEGEPVLSDLGIPATVYLPTAMIDDARPYPWYSDPPSPLSWDEIEDATERGLVDFGAHTRTHPWVTSLDDDAAWDEIAGSKLDIERRLGCPVASFAYPAGMYGPREARMVERAGYAAAVTTDPGVNAGGPASPHLLKRTVVFREDGERMFAAKLAGLLDRPSPLWKPRRRVIARRARRAVLREQRTGRRRP